MPAGGDAPPMSDAEVSAIYQSNGFQDIMQKAAAIKGAQLAEKRLEWERAPDYMKETIGAPEDVVSARTLGPEERRAVALAYKARGNDNFSISKHGSALKEFVRALSVYRWFDQTNERKTERMPLIRGESLLDGGCGGDGGGDGDGAREARETVHTLLLNIAACCVKLGDGPGALYACDEALALDPQSPKGLYRRSQAHLLEGTVSGQERALRDLAEACRLKPDDAQLRSALRKLRGEYEGEARAARERIGKGLEKGLYSSREKAEFAARREESRNASSASAGEEPESLPPPAWWKPPFSAAARAHAAKVGLDLDDKRVQDALAQMYEHSAQGLGKPSMWRTVVRRLFDNKRALSVPVLGYVLIALHVLYRVCRILSAPSRPGSAPARGAPVRDGTGWDDAGGW